jgi:methionyl-tRNA formyltransferase
VAGPRVVVFAYHTLGARCLAHLVDRGAEVALVVSHADQPGEPRWFESVAETACARGLPLLTPPTPNAADVVARVRALGPDLVLSVMYRRLLGPELLALPPLGAVNLHPSLLPRYRGRAPVNWVLVNGETRTGVTLHHMVEAADAGDIVAQAAVDVAPRDTALTLFRKIDAAGLALLAATWPALAAGTAPRTPQDHARATVVGRRRPEDGRVAWSWPAVRIANMIRAVTHPFPGAFVGDGARRLTLWEGWPEPAAGAPAGTVLDAGPGGVVVATGAGAIRLHRVQPHGGAEQDALEWARTRGLGPGTSLEEGA